MVYLVPTTRDHGQVSTPPWNGPGEPPDRPAPAPSPYAQQPYAQQPGRYPTPTGQRPRRRRPSGWWWLVPATLITLAGLTVVFFFNRAIAPLIDAGGPIPVDGQAHTLRLKTLDQHLLLVDSGYCEVLDTQSGNPVTLEPFGGNAATSGSSIYHFDPVGYQISVTCTGDPAEEAVVGPDPGGRFLADLLSGVLLAMALGGLALIVTIVLIVLFVRGAPRNQPVV